MRLDAMPFVARLWILTMLFQLGNWFRKPSWQRIVLALMLVGLLVFTASWLYPRIACALDGGSWVRDGILEQAQYCLRTYVDGGNPCRASQECSGGCFVTTPTRLGQPTPEIGVCKLDNSPFGCFAPIEHSEWYHCTD